VVAGPVAGLGLGQFVFVKLFHFPAGDDVDVNYCANTAPLARRAPLCDAEGTATLSYPEYVLPIFANGTSAVSYGVVENTDTGNPPFVGTVPGTSERGSFFCDNGPHDCSIDVTDPLLGSSLYNATPVPGNTAVLPVSFAATGDGCPSARFVNTESDFGIENLLPIAAELNCTGAHPGVAINTALDSVASIASLVQGNVQVAFTDDPEARDEQKLLRSPGVHVALIPVAVSANVIGFRATMSQNNHGYPLNLFELTPNMVAGLVTNYYQYPSNADLTRCVPPATGSCSLLSEINSVNGYLPPQSYGGFVRSDATGSTDELFHWICSAPNVPVAVGTYVVHDSNRAPKTLEAGLEPGGKPLASCPNTDQFPALSISGQYWAAANVPSQQAIKLGSLVPPPNLAQFPVAGFAPMSWSEALFYGLNSALLQNAAGEFVAPSEKSIYAALSIATRNPDGSLTPVYTNKLARDAYPMPTVIYAAVETTPMPASVAEAVSSSLRGLLALTGGSEVSHLPQGFVPLPAGMYKQAQADLAADVVVAKPPSKGGTGTTTTTSPSGGTTTSVTTTTQPVKSSGSKKPTHPRPGRKPAASGTSLLAFFIPPISNGWVVSLLVVLGVLGIIAGPLLLISLRRRRVAHTSATGTRGA